MGLELGAACEAGMRASGTRPRCAVKPQIRTYAALGSTPNRSWTQALLRLAPPRWACADNAACGSRSIALLWGLRESWLSSVNSTHLAPSTSLTGFCRSACEEGRCIQGMTNLVTLNNRGSGTGIDELWQLRGELPSTK